MAKRAAKSTAKRTITKVRRGRQSDARPKELDNLIGYRLRLAYLVQVQRFAAVGRAFNIRPIQFAILKLVYYNSRLNQTDMAQALKKKRANVVILIHELEDRGLIARVPDQEDRRLRVLHLTPAGKQLTEKLLDRHQRLTRNLEQVLGQRRLDQFFKLLDAFCRLDTDPDLD